MSAPLTSAQVAGSAVPRSGAGGLPKPSSVLILGSGPVVIGQAAEFDYAGTQACRALRAEGIRTILVNSNPATIMTDPSVADAIYLEPLTVEAVEAGNGKETPGSPSPPLGAQTAPKPGGPIAPARGFRTHPHPLARAAHCENAQAS